jgi:hypothetical protein
MSGSEYIRTDAPQQIDTAKHTGQTLPDGLVIASGNAYALPLSITVKDQQFEEIESKRTKLFVAGVITYKDILGNERETGFCWEYMPYPERMFKFCTDSRLNYYN